MPDARFSDSNVLLYLFDKDVEKVRVARQLAREGLVVSVQVLNEIANVVRLKWRRPWDETQDILEQVRTLVTVRSLDYATHRLGVDMAQRYQLSIYDGMIVAAALLAECDTLYSEDMHHGLVVEGQLSIVNPFR
jgi:predicted nucleic acid-binding protein